MADKVLELEGRINKLEEKLKLTFIEVEKRLGQQKPELNYEERFQELEDLILLLQLETTKLKDRVGEGLDFGITPNVPDVSERLTRIESELSSGSIHIPESAIDSKLASLEDRITSIDTHPDTELDDRIRASLADELEEINKKIKTLEALLAKRGHEDLEKEDSLLTGIQSILKGR